MNNKTMFEFKELNEIDNRSQFANKICKLLFDKHKGNLDEAIKEGESIFSDMEEYIKNIYELINDEIPLYAYYGLVKHSASNYGLTDFEYKMAIDKTQKACMNYYLFGNNI